MCKRNCVYRGVLKYGGGAECNYSTVALFNNDKYKTRLGILCRKYQKPSTDPMIRELMKGEHCPFYEWNGQGTKQESKPVCLDKKEEEKPKKEYSPPAPEQDLQRLYELGLPDAGIAKRLGISPDSVGRWRKSKGLKSNYSRQRQYLDTEQALELWRQGLDDKEIAERLCVTYHLVYRWRTDSGLPRRMPKKLSREEQETRRRMYLEGRSDREIAAELGCTHQGVRKWRERNQLQANYYGVNKDLLRKLYDQGLRDEEIAAKAGCSVHTVKGWRNREGLYINQSRREGKRETCQKQTE